MKALAVASRVPVPTLPTSVALLAIFVLGPLMALAIAFEYWKVFVLLVLIASVPALIRWPVATGFGMYVLVLPFDSLSAISDAGGATASKLLGVLAMGLLIGVGLVERRLAYPPVTALCLGLLAFWGLLTLGWSVNLVTSQARVSTLVSLLLLYVVAASFRVSAKELRAVVLLAILGGVLAAAVPAIMGQDSVTKTRGVKITQDEKSNINQFAVGLIAPLLLAVGQCGRRGRYAGRVLVAGGMTLIVMCLYSLASRGAVVASFLGIAFLLVRSRRAAYGLVIAVVCLLPAAFAPDVFFARFDAVLEGSDTTGSGRTRIWGVALTSLSDHWMLGSGLGTFPDVYRRYVPVAPDHNASAAHNLYLGTAVELGVLGLILLLLTLAMHFRASLRCRGPSLELVSIEGACVAVMAAALFGDYLFSKSFWLPWLLLVWAVRLHSEGPLLERRPREVIGKEDRLDTFADSGGPALRRSPGWAGSE